MNIKTNPADIDFDNILESVISKNTILNMEKLDATDINITPHDSKITKLTNKTYISLIDEMLEDQADILKEKGIPGTAKDIAEQLYNIMDDNNIGITDLMPAIAYSRAMFMQNNYKNIDYFEYLSNLIKTENYPN